MTEYQELLKHIIDLKTQTAGIEQHLKDMNDKLVKHEKFINEDHPLMSDNRKKEVDGQLKEMKEFQIKVMAIAGTIWTIVTVGVTLIAVFKPF